MGEGAGADERMSRSTTCGGGPFIPFLHETNSRVTKSSAERMTMSVSVGEEIGTSFGLRRVRMGRLLSPLLDTRLFPNETLPRRAMMCASRRRVARRHGARRGRDRVRARARHRLAEVRHPRGAAIGVRDELAVHVERIGRAV